MKKNIKRRENMKEVKQVKAIKLVLLAAFAVLFIGCEDDYISITDPDGVALFCPGMGYILSDGLPPDVGINVLDASVKHRYAVAPGVGFNLEAGDWSAAAYSPASQLGESKGNIVSLPVSSAGEVAQVALSGSVTAFTITEDMRTDITLTSFRPMTREISIPVELLYDESVVVDKVEVRLYGVVPQVDVSKGFGNIYQADGTRAAGDNYMKSVVNAGVARFVSPGLLPQGLRVVVDITSGGQVYEVEMPNQTWGTTFNGGRPEVVFALENIRLKYSMDEVGGSITPWVPDDEIEIPGI